MEETLIGSEMTLETMRECIVESISFISKIVNNDMTITGFEDFKADVYKIAQAVEEMEITGENFADIPQLAEVDSKEFSVSICTVTGQQCTYGDGKIHKAMESISSVSSFLIAQEENEGQELPIGSEPSGQVYNSMSLLNDEKPHNPLINSGHLLTCSSMFAGERADRKFENYTKIVSKMIQSEKPDYNHEMCLAEMMKAHKNYCLLY